MAFDVEGARKAGYSDAEIVDHLAGERSFDAAGARKSGYSDAEILGHLREPMKPAGPDPNAPARWESMARGIVQGATFGFADEVRAGKDAAVQGVRNLFGANGPSMGEAYDQSVTAARETLRQDMATNPTGAVMGQVAGGVGGALLTAPAAAATGLTAGAARVLAPLAARVNPLLAGVPQWAGTTARVVGGGALSGGAAGFGEGEGGLGPRLDNAATGAALGATVAPVIGGAVRLGAGVAGRVGSGLGLRDPNAAAERQIVRSLDRGGVSLDDAERRLVAGQDAPLSLLDVGSRNTVGLGATAANTPGQAMDVADAFVQGRRASRPDRLMNAGDQAFGGGSGQDVAEQLKALREQRTTEAGPLYKQAFEARLNPDDLPRAAEFIADPIGRDAMQKGLRVLELEHLARGEPFDPAAYGVRLAQRGEEAADGAPAGRFVLLEGEAPNMRLLDAVKRGYDNIVEGFRDPTSGRLNLDQYGRAVNDARAAYVGVLDQTNDVYAQARAAWGGPSAQLEAMDAGRKALRTDPDIVAQRMAQAPEDVQDAYRLGAGRDFADRVSDPARASGAARQMLEDRRMQSRLNTLLPERLNTVPRADVLNALNNTLMRETDMTAVERAVSPRAGSQTARLLAGAEDMGRDVAGPWITAASQVTSGRPIAAAGTVLNDQWRRFGQGINPATADALASRLFAVDPAQRAQIIAALRNRLMMDDQSAAAARAVALPVLRGLSTASGLQAD